MTREETKRIIQIMVETYPNYKPNNLSNTVDIWTSILEEYSYQQIAAALKAYILTDSSGFAPSIGQLVDKLTTFTQKDELTELQAWGMVRQALCNSTYNSETEFAELPPVVQKAVGSPEVLRGWATTSYSELDTVVQSNFCRTYRSVQAREKQDAKLPESIKLLLANTTDKLRIENNGNRENKV